MRILKQELYFPIIVLIHFVFWAIDLYFYEGSFIEVHSDTLFFGELNNEQWYNIHRILGEVFSSWVVTVFAFNFLMATRAKWIENIFGGLDKMYLIHRRAAVIAVFLLIAHFVVVPRDLVEFNAGKPLGFYAFVLIIIGVIISAAPPLKKKIPYHKWLNIHKLMGVFYVLAVAHGFMVKSLIKELPITRVYVFGMAIVGVLAWVYKAFLYDIFNKKLNYTVSQIKSISNDILELHISPLKDKLQFDAGQFSFITFPTVSKREQHPFTISSSPNENDIRLTIKSLGDYTSELKDKLSRGDQVILEGPFGHFTQKNISTSKQIWIAGGIGVTPFLSLAKNSKEQSVVLYWCVNSMAEAVYADELKEVANANPNFEFFIWNSDEKGYLSPAMAFEKGGLDAAYLVCGPATLKSSIFKGLKNKGVKNSKIFDEEFAFR